LMQVQAQWHQVCTMQGEEIHYVTWTGVHGATVDALLEAV